MTNYPQIVFHPSNQASCDTVDSDPSQLGPLVIKTECSVVSAGTELACLSGKESWAPLPYVPGYGSVGVLEHGEIPEKGIRRGDRIFTYGKHAAYSPTDTVVVKVPEGLAPEHACFARLAAVSITALRVAAPELGDRVAVFGLGLVGNLAAQLFALSGCRVYGVDTDRERLELANAVGIPHTLEGGDDIVERLKAANGGDGCNAVVDATGVSAVVESASACVSTLGDLILLGTPRAPHQTDLTPFLQRSHIFDQGCVSVKGAHEWRYPTSPSPAGHYKHSIERNVEIILDLLASGSLKVDPLLQRVAKPDEATDVYQKLQQRCPGHLGVVFDWRQEA